MPCTWCRSCVVVMVSVEYVLGIWKLLFFHFSPLSWLKSIQNVLLMSFLSTPYIFVWCVHCLLLQHNLPYFCKRSPRVDDVTGLKGRVVVFRSAFQCENTSLSVECTMHNTQAWAKVVLSNNKQNAWKVGPDSWDLVSSKPFLLWSLHRIRQILIRLWCSFYFRSIPFRLLDRALMNETTFLFLFFVSVKYRLFGNCNQLLYEVEWKYFPSYIKSCSTHVPWSLYGGKLYIPHFHQWFIANIVPNILLDI